MGTCIVRKVLSSKEIKDQKKRKALSNIMTLVQVALLLLVFALVLLCVYKWGIASSIKAKGVTMPNFCLPWWGMVAVLAILLAGHVSLNKKIEGQNVIKCLTSLMFVLGLASFYFALFYLSTAFIWTGAVFVFLLWRRLRFKEKLTFLPIFVLLCYISLVVYFFALIN